ncbi:MAG TPA: hypothetical protein VL524_12595, partial [Gemmatimonadaceae bacterium]|nr:hypothetical protein [Gemmatimonadaceae bacterium]
MKTLTLEHVKNLLPTRCTQMVGKESAVSYDHRKRNRPPRARLLSATGDVSSDERSLVRSTLDVGSRSHARARLQWRARDARRSVAIVSLCTLARMRPAGKARP